MSAPIRWFPALLCALAAGCGAGSGGGGDAGGTFTLIEFLESGQDRIPRNRVLTFRFSSPVAPAQDFAERLKIENIRTGPGSDFSRAIGTYAIVGEEVTFAPRLPEKPDRSDSGFRPDANYHVFLKGGPDALVSTGGDRIAVPTEFLFDTSEFFEDPDASQPPRVTALVAVDVTDGTSIDLARLDADPAALARRDSGDLIANGRVLEPGAGGAPGYATRWQFDLRMSEPLDPATVTPTTVRMLQVYENALTGTESSAPGHYGNAVNHPVPIEVDAVQRPNLQGVTEFLVRVTPVQTLVDDARYRITFGGDVLGIDFRKTFIGDNGLTGGAPEPGGQGYVTEFVVYDRAAIQASRTVTYDPFEDGVEPESGQTALSEELYNTALYNPAFAPGEGVGFLQDFGNGSDGPLAVGPGQILVLDTGDTPNGPFGSPFTVLDPNPDDEWNPTDATGGLVTYDSPTWTEYHLESLVVSNGGLLRVRGVNPVLFRVRGLVQVGGTIDLSGADGTKGTGVNVAGGEPGAGGGRGGDAFAGGAWAPTTSVCQNFSAVLTNAPASVTSKGAHGRPGTGPGRGQGGGDSWAYVYGETDPNQGLVGTGGGGGSHILGGEDGTDIRNAGGAVGTPGSACAMQSTTGTGAGWSRNSSVIGVRGVAGPTYGDLKGMDVLWGGSGGGAGGAQHQHSSFSGAIGSGGSGGGGGGSLTIYAGGSILAAGGVIDVSGGDGGQGAFRNAYTTQPSWLQATGGGGGGAGGMMVLISADNIDLSGATVDARGGAGGPPAQFGTTTSCNVCNSGGAGGNGLIFVMDRDGAITGLARPIGTDLAYPGGALVVSDFQADRFTGSAAVTELFGVDAADPEYLPLSPSDVVGQVNVGQRVRIFVSSAKASADPLLPDIATEIAGFEVALLSSTAAGTTVDITGDLGGLNPAGAPARDAFVRVRAEFEYDRIVEGAVGPFATIDEVTIPIRFNG